MDADTGHRKMARPVHLGRISRGDIAQGGNQTGIPPSIRRFRALKFRRDLS